MSEIAKRLHETRNRTLEQAKALLDRADGENRNLDGEESRQWDSLNAEVEAIDKRIKTILDGEKRAKDAEASFAAFRGEPAPQKPGDEKRNLTNAELRSFLTGADNAPRNFVVAPEGQVDYRDLVKGTASAGGNTVPTSFYNRLVEHMIETSGLLQAGVTILNTGSGENLQIPKTTAYSTATRTAEGATIAESDPAFGQVTLSAYDYTILMEVSRQLVRDTGVDLEGFLARQAGRALGNAFGNEMVNGTGSSQPRGILLDATVGKTGPTGTTTGFGTQSTVGQGGDLLIDLYHSVISPYRTSKSCGWVMNDQTAASVRKLKNSQGDYIWQAALSLGAPDTILGKPVHIDPFMPAPAANAKSILFGDFSAYYVRMVGGVEFQRSDDFAFNRNMVAYRAILSADAALTDLTGAVKVFQHSAT
ncbi:phage major capsid protein [Micromonospora sp. CPCC 206171]|uniref:phage major capsid protein n=1 Tax=Micromonospora sp. CPCC 206171 TaxID=3122405 RepID=UPI002FEF5975